VVIETFKSTDVAVKCLIVGPLPRKRVARKITEIKARNLQKLRSPKENNLLPVHPSPPCAFLQSPCQHQSMLQSQNRRLHYTSTLLLDECSWIRTNEVRFVRFLLSPPPQSRWGIRDVRRKKVEVRPTNPKVEEQNFGSANGRVRMQLQRLGVHFAPNAKKRLDLNKVLNIKENDWPPVIRQRTEALKHLVNYQESRSVNGSWRLLM
jgi:hypothetical protein